MVYIVEDQSGTFTYTSEEILSEYFTYWFTHLHRGFKQNLKVRDIYEMHKLCIADWVCCHNAKILKI